MATLESIHFRPAREVVEACLVTWEPDKLAKEIVGLPQVFWSSGIPWDEVNHWALTKATSTAGGHLKTVTSLMKHLCSYANWLEETGFDWRHFPVRLADRVLSRYRGELIEQRNRGSIRPSTASARMRAVIQFYRHAQSYEFVGRESPLWRDDVVVIQYFDAVGFARTLSRLKSELSIPNRARPGLLLEDGLTALTGAHAESLLTFTFEQGLNEIHLMLSLGFLTGARLGTVSTISVHNIERALHDPNMPGFYRMPVGPGTGISTKFDVAGDLLVPDLLMDALKTYAYSMGRLKRQAKADPAHRSKLFLTSRGNPYAPESFNRLMTDLRRRSVAARLHFMETFKFHQTRCTYGTWLMELALRVTDEASAVAFVRDAMLHKDESVTLRYVRFNQQAPVKAAMANEFTTAFAGVANRDWSKFNA